MREKMIKLGAFYRTRSGHIAVIVRYDSDNVDYPHDGALFDGQGRIIECSSWTEDGRFLRNSPSDNRDLVEYIGEAAPAYWYVKPPKPVIDVKSAQTQLRSARAWLEALERTLLDGGE